jgi:hypothetical protein
MMAAGTCNRKSAWHGGSWSVQRGGSGQTTDRWQDKGARGVLSVGRVISRGYGANSRGELHECSLRLRRYANTFNIFARCAEFSA